MKNSLLILLAVILLFSLSSCNILSTFMSQGTDQNKEDENASAEKTPANSLYDNYDPSGRVHFEWGDPHYDQTYGTYILLNMDEVYEAVDLLKKNGSTIKESILFDFDGLETGFEVIHFFHFERRYAEKLEPGKNFFDRKIDNGYFYSVVYYNNRTLEEINAKYFNSERIYTNVEINLNKTTDALKIISNMESLEVTYLGEPYDKPPYFLGDGKTEQYQIKVGDDICLHLKARIGSHESDCIFMPKDIANIIKTMEVIEEFSPKT